MWQLYDPELDETYDLPIGPSAQAGPLYKKRALYENTLGPDGALLRSDAVDESQHIELSGTLLIQAQFDALTTWVAKRYPIYIVDDLGRQTLVYLQEFTPKRERSIKYPWKHNYTLTGIVLE